uniref:DUF1365 domain-containing protein n=1 Tax=Kalanchoe fedtschenkoi TaxID=63787 RepID=A0A7N0V4X6_KALFE
MEALFLLFSILSTFLTSLTLSLLLFLRRQLPARSAPSPPRDDAVRLYRGTVWHQRRRPVPHSFQYSVKYALIDLDQSPENGHLSADEARAFAATNGPVLLLTIPSSVGYEQNPLSVYYCYETGLQGRCLKKCIAVVTNTPWGEKVRFVFDPASDLVAKPLHVSPFMDMLGNWSIKTREPAENLFIEISVKHPELGDYFTASLKARRVPNSSSDHAWFFWLMPHKVAIWIYWHALKLWWKNVSFIQHPRYSNPNYREDALLRNRKLQCCPVSSFAAGKSDEGSNLSSTVNKDIKDRPCMWTDAKWPWS